MIIDAHTHCYPPEAAVDPLAWGTARGERHWVELVTNGPQGWATREAMLAEMDAHGVDRAVLAGWYWENQATAEEQTAWHLEWAAAAPGRFLPFIPVQPCAGRAALRAVERALGTGRFCGIGELMSAAQGFSMEDAGFADLCALATEAEVPVLMHVTEPVGHEYPGRLETPLDGFVRLAERFPRLQLILAHWGGGLPFYRLNRRVRKALRNAWVDTAAGPLLYAPEVWAAGTSLMGADRVLFGTDYPLRLYPRSGKGPGYAEILAEARSALPDGRIHAEVLGENARRLFGLSNSGC
ncbi:MAG: amidohydrolase family protein [Opitutales bacterium]|nr:amidohydrolase family protein [Opitutales bacterium]